MDLNTRKVMTNRVNSIMMALLMVLGIFASGLNISPTGNSTEMTESTPVTSFSGNSTDYDGDGISNSNDSDDDNDNVNDSVDSCSMGDLNWSSTTYTDHDSDGCRDSTEDSDDDNDGMFDASDDCQKGALNWISSNTTDYDSDGCRDVTEDPDDDNDGVLDTDDNCPRGDLGWISTPSTDADADGCRDSTEDPDGGGNNSGVTESVTGGPWGNNFTSSSIIDVNWSAADLVINITYNVTVDVYAHNATTNTTYVIWDDFTVFNATSNASSGTWSIPSATLPTGCYYGHIDLYDNDDGMYFDSYNFGIEVDMDCSGGSGNNGSTMEWIYASPSTNTTFLSNSWIYIDWSTGDLVINITYNVTLDIYAHNATTNTTYVIWDDFTVFNATSNGINGVMEIPNLTLPAGCYFASIGLHDNTDGMHFDNDGFDLDIETDCSGGSGNNTGPMESLHAWTDNSNYSSSDDIDLKWNATSLDLDTNYNVGVGVYGHNATSNSTSIVWSDDSAFNPTAHGNSLDWFHDGFTIYAGTLSTGCYYASFNLSDDDDGMVFANTGFEFGVNMECSSTGGNNTGNNGPKILYLNDPHPPYSNTYDGEVYHLASNQAMEWVVAMDGLTNGSEYRLTLAIENITVQANWIAEMLGDEMFYASGNTASINYYTPTQYPDGCYDAWAYLIQQPENSGFGDAFHFTIDIGNSSCSPPSNNTGGDFGDGNNTNQMSYSANLDQYCWNSTDIIEISIEMHGLNMSQIELEWEIRDFETSEIYASNGNEPTIGGLLNVSTTGSVYYTWQFEAGSAWLPAEPGKYEIMINPADTSLSNLFTTSPYYYTIEIGCNDGPSDCGINASWTELMVWTNNSVYYQGNTVDATIVSNCTVIGETYILEYELMDSQMNIITSNVANPYWWDAADIFSIEYLSWGGNLTADNYCLNVDLLDLAMNAIDSQTHCFTVNAPSTSWNNNTVRLIYIKPLSQSADQHTPLSLHFVANPMAANSPYDASLICSKDDGYSADVWEAYVPLPFNNITSWKVKNTYGIVLGMFVMYDAELLGASSMQNPMIIYEQNLTFSGHSPSILVDNANFECPMVTVSSSITPVMVPSGDVISYAVDISVNNSGAWTGDLNWEVTTVSNNASFALADIGGHLLVESSGALLDSQFSPDGVIADYICVSWELVDENEDILSEGENCIEFIPLSEPECTLFTISNVAEEYLEGNPVSIWFNTNLECHGYTIQYWINSTLIGEATSGSIDIDANDASSWMSSGANEISNAIMWTETDIDQPEICIEANLISSTNQSVIIDSESICFSVVLPSEPTWEVLCEEWEYWNQDMIDTTLPGNGCPYYEDEADAEEEDAGAGLPAIGSFATLSAAVLAVFVIATRREEQ